ncbi:MAG: hypothetical protein PUD15_09405 [Prevotella sp.]|nr:hypothetical protein [Prevotella sp.]
MKHGFLFLFSAAALLTACSTSDDSTTTPIPESQDRAQINLNLSMPKVVTKSVSSSRAVGTVGDIEGTNNVWAGEVVHIAMMDKGKLTYAKELDANGNATTEPIYEWASMNTPEAVDSGLATRSDHYVKYYPVLGNYDFWGYYADDAATGAPAIDNTYGNYMVLPFQIDGSQDLMTAKAELTPAQKALMDDQGSNSNRYYSAFSARRKNDLVPDGVQPIMTFNHQLTRLKFHIKAADSLTADPVNGVQVTGIAVRSKNKGNLIIAYNDYTDYTQSSNLALFTTKDSDSLCLKQRPVVDGKVMRNQQLVDLTPVSPKWNSTTNQSDTVNVGEALLVAPQESYNIFVAIKQYVMTRGAYTDADGTAHAAEYDWKTVVVPATIHRSDPSQKFVKGVSYNVYITLHGLEKIDVVTKLGAWIEGEDIDLDLE